MKTITYPKNPLNRPTGCGFLDTKVLSPGNTAADGEAGGGEGEGGGGVYSPSNGGNSLRVRNSA